MKQIHRKDLFGWSEFNKERNLDFHSVLWVREGGNVLIDPLPMSEHDHSHLQRLGGVNFIVITNSDHCRDAEHIASTTGAAITISAISSTCMCATPTGTCSEAPATPSRLRRDRST